MESTSNKEASTKASLNPKNFLTASEEIRKIEKDLPPLFSLWNFRRSAFYVNMFYPHHAIFIDSPLQYLNQSRLVLHITYLLRAWFFLARKGFKIDILKLEGKDQHNIDVITHNLWENFNLFQFSRGRIERMVYLLRLAPAKRNGKTLCVGPKNEGELLLFRRNGFTNVIGIDLFSYCPSILPMDVAHMTFANDTFDTINCGSMLQYVEDLEQVAREIVRVAKPDALVTFSLTIPQPGDHSPYVGDLRAGDTESTLALFGANVKHVYFRNDVDHLPGHKHEVVFQIKK